MTLSKDPEKPASKATPTSRKQLTPEQRAVQDALKKVKRLNVKLSRVKQLAVSMDNATTKHSEFTARQIKQWSTQLLNILNGPNV